MKLCVVKQIRHRFRIKDVLYAEDVSEGRIAIKVGYSVLFI